MKKVYLFVLLCILISPYVNAQAVKVIGTVTDGKDALPGVTVRVKGTNTGTATDDKGKFSLNVPAAATLEISFIGYETKTLKVAGEGSLNVKLEPSNSTLQESVIIGYQKVTRKTTTAAISSISGKELQNQPAASFDQMLQGRLSGVNVQNYTGMPGARTSVSVRGNSLVNSSYDQNNVVNNPLYVVDGVPLPTESYEGPTGGSASNYLAGINPMDIESIDVLKDASAAAIYGSRAANGVILITTKKGTSGRTRVGVSAYTGYITRPELRDATMGVTERRQKMDLIDPLTLTQKRNLPYILTDSLNPAYNANTDWQNLFFQRGLITNADMNISGGGEQSSYRFSLGYYDEDGIIKATGFSRYTARFTLNARALDNKLDINPIITYFRSDKDRGNGDDNVPMSLGAGNMPSSLLALDPELKDALLGAYDKMLDKNIDNNMSFALNLGLSITPHLRLASQNSYIYQVARRDQNMPNSLTGNGNTSASFNSTRSTMLSSNFITYSNTFGKHTLSAVVGTDINFDQYQAMAASGTNGVSDQIQIIGGFQKINTDVGASYDAFGLLSYYARLAYDFDTKYIFSFSGRYDGSSKFGKNNKWGFFPSASAAWLLSEEGFLKNNTLFSLVKVRASYGSSGALPKENYLQYNLYRVNNGAFNGNNGATSYDGVSAVTPDFSQAAQDNLSWEKSDMWNVGLDLEVQKGKYSAAIDVYNKENSLQLFSITLPYTSGYNNSLTNSLGVRNYGLDLTIAANPLPSTSKVKWFSRLVLSYNKGEITALPNGGRDLVFTSGDRFDKLHIMSVGAPVNAFYLLQTKGVYVDDDAVPGNPYTGDKFRNPNYIYKGGDFIFADLDGDFNVDIFNDGINPDKKAMGNPNPLYTGGFYNSFNWKSFDLSVFCTYTFKRDVMNIFEADQFSNSTTNALGFVGASTPDISKLDIWRKPGDKATYAKFDYGTYGYYYTSAQSFFMEPGGYFRVKNITLSYNVTANLLRKLKLDRFRVYAMMDNVLMIQKSKKLPDAENVNQYGEYDGGGYPIPKKYTLGIDLNF